jgi:hypothetical protein
MKRKLLRGVSSFSADFSAVSCKRAINICGYSTFPDEFFPTHRPWRTLSTGRCFLQDKARARRLRKLPSPGQACSSR